MRKRGRDALRNDERRIRRKRIEGDEGESNSAPNTPPEHSYIYIYVYNKPRKYESLIIVCRASDRVSDHRSRIYNVESTIRDIYIGNLRRTFLESMLLLNRPEILGWSLLLICSSIRFACAAWGCYIGSQFQYNRFATRIPFSIFSFFLFFLRNRDLFGLSFITTAFKVRLTYTGPGVSASLESCIASRICVREAHIAFNIVDLRYL